MAGDEVKPKSARTRSPGYPYLALPEALERTAQLRRAEGRHAVSVSVAMQHWGYKAESSTGYSCIAALKKFGLVDEEGVGEHREVRLSVLALAILLDGDEGSPDRAAALRTAALSPRIHTELWERYGPELPSDQTLRRFLLLEKNFNEASVDEFIAEYRATIVYAGLAGATDATGVPPPPPPGNVARRPGPAPARPAAPREAAGKPPGPALPGLDAEEPPRPADARGERGAPEPRPERAPAAPTPPVTPPTPREVTAAAPVLIPEGSRELPVPLDNNLVVRVPYPMSEESFALLIDTLQLWKKRLVRPVE